MLMHTCKHTYTHLIMAITVLNTLIFFTKLLIFTEISTNYVWIVPRTSGSKHVSVL